MSKSVPTGYPTKELIDNSVNMLTAGFQVCPDVWSFRIAMILNIEICIKKLVLYLRPDLVSSNSKSHQVLNLLGLLAEHIPKLDIFMASLSRSDKVRWRAIIAFSYTQERYSSYSLETIPPLPLPEDLVEIYWILSESLYYFNLD